MANRLQIARRPAYNVENEEDSDNEMPESRPVLAEREHGAAIARLLERQIARLEQQNARLEEQNARLQEQLAEQNARHQEQLAEQNVRLQEQGFEERQRERLERQNNRDNERVDRQNERLDRQNDRLDRQNERVDRRIEREFLGARLHRTVGGRVERRAGRPALAGVLQDLADALN